MGCVTPAPLWIIRNLLICSSKKEKVNYLSCVPLTDKEETKAWSPYQCWISVFALMSSGGHCWSVLWTLLCLWKDVLLQLTPAACGFSQQKVAISVIKAELPVSKWTNPFHQSFAVWFTSSGLTLMPISYIQYFPFVFIRTCPVLLQTFSCITLFIWYNVTF